MVAFLVVLEVNIDSKGVIVMKKILVFLCCFGLIIASGCSNDKDQCQENDSNTSETTIQNNEIESTDKYTISDKYRISENGEVWNYFGTLNQLVEETDCYSLFSDLTNTGYKYEIYGEDKIPFWYGYTEWRCPIFELDGDILKMRIRRGANIGFETFFNVKEKKMSRYFEMVLDNSGELVAYFGGTAPSGGIYIIIQNMFDPDDFYLEFVRNVSDSSLINSYALDAEFIENDTKFKLTYQTAKDYKEVTEIFDLR